MKFNLEFELNKIVGLKKSERQAAFDVLQEKIKNLSPVEREEIENQNSILLEKLLNEVIEIKEEILEMKSKAA